MQEPVETSKAIQERTRVRTACTRDCPETCGILATVEDGQVVAHEGDPNHPVTGGHLCYKGQVYLRHYARPDRVLYPQRRTSRGWQRVSWDEALDLAAENLRRCRDVDGPQSVLFGAYGGMRGVVKQALCRCFFSELGGVTLLGGGICTEEIDAAHLEDLGAPGGHETEDVLNARGIVVWGRNPAVTHPRQMAFFRQARAAGATLVVIDPVATGTARAADLHLQLRPGSDWLLALGVGRVLLERDAVDWDFVAQHTTGFEGYRSLVMARTLSEVARACDVEVRDIEQLAEIFATRRPTATFLGLGLCYYRPSRASIRLVDALVALSGNLGIAGGGVSGDLARLAGLEPSLLEWPSPESTRRLPLPRLGAELTTTANPAIRMAWFAGANPVASAPDGRRIAEALDALPFVMVVDQVITATAERAHLFLPCTTYLEDEDLAASYGHHYLSLVQRAVAPRGECRPDEEIFQALAARLGFGDALAGDPQTWIGRLVAPLAAQGVTPESLKEGVRHKSLEPAVPFADKRFATPSGRFEFITSFTAKQEEVPPSSVRLLATKTTRMLNLEALPEDLPETPRVRVHPETIRRLGLEAGARVRVISPMGHIEGTLQADGRVHGDIALINPARWQGELIGVNLLREPVLTDSGESAAMHETFVRLEPAVGTEVGA